MNFASLCLAIAAALLVQCDQPLVSHGWSHDLDYYIGRRMISSVMFEHRVEELSLLSKGRRLNFLIIGACDGTHDRLIASLLDNETNGHWRAVLVEAVPRTFDSLLNNTKRASHRLGYLNVAADGSCDTPTKKISFINVKSSGSLKGSLPHWFTHEIATIDPNLTEGVSHFLQNSQAKSSRLRLNEWGGANNSVALEDLEYVTQDVQCITGSDLLLNATRMLGGAHIHVVKIDAEGRDYAISSSMLQLLAVAREKTQKKTLLPERPLLIEVECKFMSNDQRTWLRKMAYSVGYNSTLSNPRYARFTRNDCIFFLDSWQR